MKKSTAILAGAVAGAVGYAALVRPRYLRSGATWRERSRIWAGDELMPQPATQSTHVVTIEAPAERVWPWVAQLGQDRGGFYSYTALENLVGTEMKNADDIHPEWQKRELGERVWLCAPSKCDGKAYMIVARWIPERAIVLVAPPDWERLQNGKPANHIVWSVIIEPISPKSCRLIARTLSGKGQSASEKIAYFTFWEPAHFVMERGMMLGIKKRAEEPEHRSLPVQIYETAAAVATAAQKMRDLRNR
jgi:hypothetical protein